MDAITMLKDEHAAVEKLFKEFEAAGDRAHVRKRDLVDKIVEALSAHAAVEEQIFYPVARATVEGTEDITLESLEEHHVAKWLLEELRTMDPHHERFDAKVAVLIENVRHHVEEEETELFPKVREALGRNDMNELGDAMVAAREVAPTRPHPRSPQSAPANMVVGAVAGLADRVSDTVSGLAQGGVAVAQDAVAIVLRRPRPSLSPRGSRMARTTARRVRSGAQDTAEALIESIETARRTGSATVDAATSGAKATATAATSAASDAAEAVGSGAKATRTSATKGAKQAATTAKRSATTAKRTAAKGARQTKARAKAASTSTRRAASSAR